MIRSLIKFYTECDGATLSIISIFHLERRAAIKLLSLCCVNTTEDQLNFYRAICIETELSYCMKRRVKVYLKIGIYLLFVTLISIGLISS